MDKGSSKDEEEEQEQANDEIVIEDETTNDSKASEQLDADEHDTATETQQLQPR